MVFKGERGSGGTLARNFKQGLLGGAWDLPNPPMLLVLFITFSIFIVYIYMYIYIYVVFVRTEEAPHSRSNL